LAPSFRGAVPSVATTVARAARERGLPVRVLGASFEEARDADAGIERNQRLVDACDVLVAFWDGASKGTRNTVERALDSGKEVHVFLGGGGGSPATESRGPQRAPTS